MALISIGKLFQSLQPLYYFDTPFTKFSIYRMGIKIVFMSCIMMVNKLLFLKICRKYGRHFISMMHVSMHEDQNMITMQQL